MNETKRDNTQNIQEETMGVDIPKDWSNTQKRYSSLAIPENRGKTINEIKPKKIIIEEKPFTPYVKAAKKEPPKEFIPYIKSQNQSMNPKKIADIQVKRKPININVYSADSNKGDDDQKPGKDVNYWGKKNK